jgi:hypothetical protein
LADFETKKKKTTGHLPIKTATPVVFEAAMAPPDRGVEIAVVDLAAK